MKAKGLYILTPHFQWAIIFIVFLFIQNTPLLSQEKQKIDSIQAALKTVKTDTAKIDILIDLALSYGSSDEKNLTNLEKALDLAIKIRDHKRKGLIEGHISSYYYYTGQYHLAIQHTKYAVDIYKELKDSMRYINSVNNLGILFRRIGNYHKSLEYNHIQLTYYLKKRDSLNLAKTYNNLGNLYNDYGDAEKALEYQKENLRIRKKLEDFIGIGSAYNNLALLYENQKMSDTAIYYYQRALSLPDIKQSSTLYGAIHNNLAIVYKTKGNNSLAEYHLLKALQFRDSVGDTHGSCQTRGNLADTYRLMGNSTLAKKYAEEGMRMAKKYNHLEELWRNYLHLAKINKELKNFQEAYNYMELYADVKDSLRNKDEIRKMAQVEIGHKYNQKMLEDSLNREQEKELFLKQQELENIAIVEKQKRQEVIAWFSAGVGLVLLVLVFILIKNNRDKSETNRIISDKNAKIELQKFNLEVKNKEVLDSINYARRIQNAILPTEQELDDVLPEYCLLFNPKDIISGDFYWMDKFENNLFVAVADCTGHGVPGAIVSVICANALSKSIEEEGNTETGKILDRTREIVVDQLSKNNSTVQDGMDISFLRFIYNDNGTLQSAQWSGANNPLWILRKNSDQMEELQPNKQPIGKYASPIPFETNHISIDQGDTFYLFTDGFADQFGGEKGKKLKRANFKTILFDNRTVDLQKLKKELEQSFADWKGPHEQVDDICVMAIRV
jgi:serine phosphatase RsbU (regulator of sigma subunit)